MKRYLTTFMSIAFALAPIAANAATVTPISGQVLINQGNGYISITGPTVVGPGDTVMVYPGGSAQLSYGGGCNTSVQPGTVASVSSSSPCSSNTETQTDATQTETAADGAPADGAAAATGGVNFTTIAVGAGIIAGGVGLALAAGGGGSDDEKNATPASP